ncbi:MAG: SsrA-binding protein SmpB [Patescibacteria group bacterium]|nr:SsrA-binding protein SmpB [Patescibacteria group bacterium]
MPTLANNRRASFDYDLLENYEAGLVLFGHEAKSAKAGHVNLSGAYVSLRSGSDGSELWLVGAHISPYRFAGQIPDYSPTRERKLLLNKKEIAHLIGKTQEKGLTLVPVKMYTKRSFVKLEFALGKGKKKYDKRESIKKRELDRQIRTLTKRQISR